MRAVLYGYANALNNSESEALNKELVVYDLNVLAYYVGRYNQGGDIPRLELDMILDTLGLCTTGSGHFINDCERMDCRNV